MQARMMRLHRARLADSEWLVMRLDQISHPTGHGSTLSPAGRSCCACERAAADSRLAGGDLSELAGVIEHHRAQRLMPSLGLLALPPAVLGVMLLVAADSGLEVPPASASHVDDHAG